MKILFTVQSFSPATHGMSEITERISMWLLEQGHEVTIATKPHPDRKTKSFNGLAIKEFDISGNMVAGYRGKDIYAYQEYLLNSRFDVIVNFLTQIAFTDLVLPLLKHIHGKKVLVPTCFLMYGITQWNDYYTTLLEYMKFYDACVYHSDQTQDYKLATAAGLTNGFIIPNGASKSEFIEDPALIIREKYAIPQNDLLVLHVGQFTGYKGQIEALDIFCRSSLQHATFLLVAQNFVDTRPKNVFRNFLRLGRWVFIYLKFYHLDYHPTRLVNEKLGFTGLRIFYAIKNIFFNRKILMKSLNRKETIAAFKDADLFLFPSKLECSPIVIAECLAAGTAFLAADVGNIRETIEKSSAGVLLPTRNLKHELGSAIRKKQSIQIFNSITRDRESLRAMGENGFRLWEDILSWEQIVAAYENLFKKI